MYKELGITVTFLLWLVRRFWDILQASKKGTSMILINLQMWFQILRFPLIISIKVTYEKITDTEKA